MRLSETSTERMLYQYDSPRRMSLPSYLVTRLIRGLSYASACQSLYMLCMCANKLTSLRLRAL